MKKTIALIIGLYLIFTLTTYKDFGITADEFSSYISGQIWLEYFQNKELTYNLARYHPLVNEHYRIYSMVMFILVGSLKYEIFHLLNLLAFVPVLIAGSILIYKTLPKKWFSVMPLVFVLLSPRILGDIAANPKDMPFSVAYFVAISIIFLLLSTAKKNQSYFTIILLGLLFGYTQSLRPLGFTLYLIYFFWNYVTEARGLAFNRSVFLNIFGRTLLIFLVGLFVMTATWPAIGANFLANFKKYLSLGTEFNLWEGTVFYLGKEYAAGSLPWHYLFIWVGITIPFGYLILILQGFSQVIGNRGTRLQTYLTSIVLLHLGIYLLITPTLYNGIRHYSFLILILSFMAGINLVCIREALSGNKKTILSGIVAIYLLMLTYTNYKLHPFQNIYFNELSGGLSNATTLFDTDYWDQTYIEAAEKLHKYLNGRDQSEIYSCGARTAMEYYLKDRIKIVKNIEEADMLICPPREMPDSSLHPITLDKVSRMNTVLLEIRARR